MKGFYARYNRSTKAHRGACRAMMVVALAMFCAIGTLNAQEGCYSKSRSSGIAAMNKKQYDTAIQWFEQAKGCPDKPSSNDLDAKIKECQNLKAKAAKEKKDAEERRRKDAEAARLREEQERIQREYELEMEMQMARSSYMNITGISFVNVDKDGNLIAQSGILYMQDIKYLRPVLSYNGLADSERNTTLYCKIFKPNGNMIQWSDSPDGYSYDYSMIVEPGLSNEQVLTAWGSNDGGTFSIGTYTFEVYSEEGILLDSRQFSVFDKPPTTVQVTFRVGDSDATIYVDGSYSGKGSSSMALEIGKTYRVEARKQSHTTTSMSVTASKDMSPSIVLDSPKPIYGSLYITASKRDVAVSLNGVQRGLAPMTINQLLIGDYRVKLTKNKFRDYERTVTVKANETTSLHAEMEKIKRGALPFSYVFLDPVYGFDGSLGGHFAFCKSHVGFFAHYLHGLTDKSQSISGGVVFRLTNNGVDLQLFAGPAYNTIKYDYYYGSWYDSQWLGNVGMRLSWRSKIVFGLWDIMGGVMTDFGDRAIPYVGVGLGISLAGGLILLTAAAAGAS